MHLAEINGHLYEKLIPFWENMQDREHGGFYGLMNHDLVIDRKASKGSILNSRILWFFSQSFLLYKEERLLELARHAYVFLKDFFIDAENDGIYWSVTYDGRPEDVTKHTYSQAFAIYGLAAYYEASKDWEALETAQQLFLLIESRCRDTYGYGEAYGISFEPVNNDKLSENGVTAEKTMNTILHVFEAYTELYKVSQMANCSWAESVRQALEWMSGIFVHQIYNKEKRRLDVFFDRQWNSLLDMHSYGHDIEAAWLLDRGSQILGNHQYKEELAAVTKNITEKVYETAYRDGVLWNEEENGNQDQNRIWWVQAEAITGFIHACQKSKDEKYLEAANSIWDYIKTTIIDPRDGSEWFWLTDPSGEPDSSRLLAGPWKCPYHNGRMCIEVLRRLGHAS